jgi:hypothetical protein
MARTDDNKAHDYQACEDDACPMFGCRAFKAGYRRGYADGLAAGEIRGYVDGYAAGAASAGAAAR